MNKSSVSIVTVSQLSNYECLKVLFDNIKDQSYKNIKEWIILDGSETMDESICNKVLVNEMILSDKSVKFEIKYIPFESFKSLSQLKDIANSIVLGDYIIWMDDNDYHMTGRIEYSVNKLLFNNKQIGGNLNIYIHDIDLGETIKNNTSNTTIIPKTLIYHKNYLKNNKYSDDIEYIKNNISEFEILIPETTLVKLIHKRNIETKKQLTLNVRDNTTDNFIKLERGIRKFLIPDNYYDRYLTILKTKNNNVGQSETNYDITYFTGVKGLEWDPEDKTLGGSEQAVVNLSENWVKQGKSIVVYGLFNEEKNVNGVEYKHSNTFQINQKFNILILWRALAINVFLETHPLADKIILDLHDNFSYTLAHFDRPKLLKLLEKVTKINFKSEYHKKCFEEFTQNKIEPRYYNIIPNGIRVESFQNNKCLNDDKIIIRNQYRFCYCSSYDRGLENILTHLWPNIYKQEPRAEFHVYYGMNHIYNENFRNRLKQLLAQPGVMDHGRQPMDMVIREKHLSTFHLYISNSIAEIDCISIRESLVAGCIPIISNTGVFAYRHGIQFCGDMTSVESCKLIINGIIGKMNDIEFINNARQQLMKSSTIINWHDVAKKWLTTF
jgi:hypothetical protein